MPIEIKRDGDGDPLIATATDMTVRVDQIDVQNAGLEYEGDERFVVGTVYRIREDRSSYRVRYVDNEGLGAGFKRFGRGR